MPRSALPNSKDYATRQAEKPFDDPNFIFDKVVLASFRRWWVMSRSVYLAVPVCLLLLAALAIYTRAQHTKVELEVDGVMLHLGMAKTEVAAKLAGRQYWKVNDDNWVVAAPNDIGPLIQFTSGKLNFTERFWATNENDTGMALFGAVNSLNKDGFHVCDVAAGVNTKPDLTAHNVRISCGDKSVLVNRDTFSNHSYTMVHEELGLQHDIKFP